MLARFTQVGRLGDVEQPAGDELVGQELAQGIVILDD
jgi:hypothetical protein